MDIFVGGLARVGDGEYLVGVGDGDQCPCFRPQSQPLLDTDNDDDDGEQDDDNKEYIHGRQKKSSASYLAVVVSGP